MKSPFFYCENCGREVNSNLNTCPGCGEKFISVRCPSCGYTGNAELFKKNCPNCGYTGDIKEKVSKDKCMKAVKSTKLLSSRGYIIIILFMMGLIALLLRLYFKL